MYKVAFIDDGIMQKIQELPEQIKKYKIINGILQEKEEDSSVFCLSHATMCFWVFAEYAMDKKYILYDIQILNEFTSSGNMQDLTKALQFCLDEEVDLINMSLGRTHYISCEGEDILEKLYNRGTIMIAAQNNSNQVTYPACSPYVYGVTRDYIGVLKKDQFYYVNNKSAKIDIISHCEFSEIESKHGVIMGKQNSFSAPYISALIYNELQKGENREEIQSFLRKNSVSPGRMSQWEYKMKSIPNWQDEITAPVIGIHAKKSISQHLFVELISGFRKKEFHTVGIWFGMGEIKECPYIFTYHINEQDQEYNMNKIIKWVFNIARPDIILMGHDYNTTYFFDNVADLILTDSTQNNDNVLLLEKEMKQSIQKIIDYFE